MSWGGAMRLAVLGAVLPVVLTVTPARAHENTVVHRGLGHWSVDILGNPFYTPAFRTEIGNGSDQEDVPATRSLGHFYNPETDSAPSFAFGAGPATENSQEQYDAAITEYMNNNFIGTDAALHRMGRALHFIQDMTSPAHTHDDDHAFGDDFEGFGPGNFPSMNFAAVTPKFAVPPTAEGFVEEIARLIYDQTVYQAVLHENSSVAQPNSLYKQMFPSLHYESGGLFVDDHFEIDRIGDWGCDLLCADDWWMPDELLTTDNGGPGGSTRYTGSAYVENTGGDGGPVVPVVFGGQPNSANESLLQLYARYFYPEAIAYGAGLLEVFAGAVGAPLPSATPTQTPTSTETLTPLPSATPALTPVDTLTPTFTQAPSVTPTATVPPSATPTETAPPSATPTETPPPSATPTDTQAPSATSTPTHTPTHTPSRTPSSTPSATALVITATPTSTAPPVPSATPSETPTPEETPTETPTPTPAGLCAATPRIDCGTPLAAEQALLKLRNSDSDLRDKLLWRWSNGNALLHQFGSPQTSTAYALCIYDHTGGTPSLAEVASAPPAGTCGGKPCWKALSLGFRYRNRSASDDGVQLIRLKGGVDGKAKLQVKAKGSKLMLPTPVAGELFAQDPMVTVQLVNSDGYCWGASFSAPADRNDPGSFKDKSD